MKPHVVAVGGGHGLAATIRAVRRYAGQTTAVVATADDGGSTGRLRTGMAMPAPGDVRRCLAAMTEPLGDRDPGSEGSGNRALVEALEFRFEGTDVQGHALGNLLLAALAAVTGDFLAAVDEAARLLGIDRDRARVLPATVEPVALHAARLDGSEVRGQVAISRMGGVERVAVQPLAARAPIPAVEAIFDADQIVLGPGSLFTSVLAAAVVEDVLGALANSRARLVYVCNLRAEGAETFGFDVADHVAAVRRHGIDLDVVVAQAGGLPLGDLQPGVDVVTADVARPHGLSHDSAKLAAALAELVR
ncbi:MAG TPA: uridine diphosphate-N-acetylglucosamine-binding protein YvcK [Acidimicrobiales bacterium]|jgi:uncharacterized cofD-like protein|nr:uridine diphosphate-N-acetylglucosamine-binding protein YvcK [Acidimicrobiales bacterium]